MNKYGNCDNLQDVATVNQNNQAVYDVKMYAKGKSVGNGTFCKCSK